MCVGVGVLASATASGRGTASRVGDVFRPPQDIQRRSSFYCLIHFLISLCGMVFNYLLIQFSFAATLQLVFSITHLGFHAALQLIVSGCT